MPDDKTERFLFSAICYNERQKQERTIWLLVLQWDPTYCFPASKKRSLHTFWRFGQAIKWLYRRRTFCFICLFPPWSKFLLLGMCPCGMSTRCRYRRMQDGIELTCKLVRKTIIYRLSGHGKPCSYRNLYSNRHYNLQSTRYRQANSADCRFPSAKRKSATTSNI